MKPNLRWSQHCREAPTTGDDDEPFAQPSVEVDDGLRALNVTETPAPPLEHLVTRLRQQATNVDVGLASLVLQRTVKRLQRRRRSWNGRRDAWQLGHDLLDLRRGIAEIRLLGQWDAVRSHHRSRRRCCVCEAAAW